MNYYIRMHRQGWQPWFYITIGEIGIWRTLRQDRRLIFFPLSPKLWNEIRLSLDLVRFNHKS